jgi:hypothetical protein
VRLAPPEAAQGFGAVAEHLLAVLEIVLMAGNDEIVRHPAAGDAKADPPAGDVVDDRPFLGHADRVVQRQDDAARADLDALVTPARAAASTEGLGESPPKLWKCRSGTQSRAMPFWSAQRAA